MKPSPEDRKFYEIYPGLCRFITDHKLMGDLKVTPLELEKLNRIIIDESMEPDDKYYKSAMKTIRRTIGLDGKAK